jgi:hypothetical protein
VTLAYSIGEVRRISVADTYTKDAYLILNELSLAKSPTDQAQNEHTHDALTFIPVR